MLVSRESRRMSAGLMILVFCLCSPAIQAQIVVAHRGASAVAPENTLSAFREAWALGADAVEGDFYLTRDSQIVCIHDKTTKRTAEKELDVAGSSLAELRRLDVGSWKGSRFKGEQIPTLQEVLATVPPEKHLFLEIKCGPEIVPRLKEILQHGPLPTEQVVIISFSEQVVTAVKRAMPRMTVQWLVGFEQEKGTGRWSPTFAQIAAKVPDLGVDGIDCQGRREVVNSDFARRARDVGLELHVWTIDDADSVRYYQRLGVDSITTNRPRLVRQAMANATN